MRSAALLVCCVLWGCSSDDAGPTDPGKLSLEDVTSTHAATTLRFTVTLKNTTAKNVKTLDSIEVDPGSGAQRATAIQQCEGSDVSPWLVKAKDSATVDFTIRNNGPERMVVESKCFENGKASSRSALWEFLGKIETNGSSPIELAWNGTFDDGAIYSLKAVSTRQ